MTEFTTIRLLRSSDLSHRPSTGPGGLVEGQPAVNFNSLEPGLFFSDDEGDLFKVGPCHVGATAPNSNPPLGAPIGNIKGETWLDTSNPSSPLFKVWDGSAWRVSISGETGSLWVSTEGDDDNSGLSPSLPKKTIKAALQIATTGTVIHVSPGSYPENNPLIFPADNIALIGQGHQVTEISPENDDEDLIRVRNDSLIQGFSFVGASLGSKSVISFVDANPNVVISSPPFVRDCANYIGESVSLYADGEIVSGTPKIVANGFFSQFPSTGGVGFKASNKGVLEINNCETVYASESVLATGGGFIRATNCKSTYGDYALVSQGVGDLEDSGIIESLSEDGTTFEVSSLVSRPYEGQVLTVGDQFFKVCSVNILFSGEGYSTVPQVVFSSGSGPNGAAAQGVAIIENGQLARIDILFPGRYLESDDITISIIGGNPGLGDPVENAAAEAVKCPILYAVEEATELIGGTSVIKVSEPLGYLPNSEDPVNLYRVSKIVAVSHYMGFVGSGSTLPEQGGAAISSNQILKEEGGQIFCSSLDHSGKFRVGEDLIIDQLSGKMSGASFTNSVLSLVIPYILSLS